MRISDWSSDVCSSDLRVDRPVPRKAGELSTCVRQQRGRPRRRAAGSHSGWPRSLKIDRDGPAYGGASIPDGGESVTAALWSARSSEAQRPTRRAGLLIRSEEHTSELQSLMRISYAVFCLKKNKYQHIT